MTETFDIAIVGAGITGCAIARQLVRYDLSICVVEAANDIALGAHRRPTVAWRMPATIRHRSR